MWLNKSGSRREHAARIENGCLIAHKARHRDEQLGDMNRPHDRETTARRIEIEEPFLQRGSILAGRTACQIRRQTQRQTLRPCINDTLDQRRRKMCPIDGLYKDGDSASSEERRGGKEGVRRWRLRWST